MPVSERDREHFRKLGEAKALAHREAAEAHRALPLDERLARSWDLYVAFGRPAPEERDDDPTPFYERARALGLYQG
jgi:hypothetical protein